MEYIKELLVPNDIKQKHLNSITKLMSWNLTKRQLCDLELLMNGGFNPLEGFLNEEDYHSVCTKMRLNNNKLWPIPITLDVTEEFANKLTKSQQVVLRDNEEIPLAILTIESIYKPDKKQEALSVFNTTDIGHPGVDYLFNTAHNYYLGGKVLGIQLPTHYDYRQYRHTPNELRAEFMKKSWKTILAFQTRNPMHKAHYELTMLAIKENKANLLIHPAVGMTKPNDIDHYTRVKCYEHILTKYPTQISMLSLLPIAMRMAGPKEALWHSIIRKNYGVTHFIIGRDHAGSSKNSNGNSFYNPYDAQQLVAKYQKEIAITMVPFQELLYVENKAQYLTKDKLAKNDTAIDISGTEFRRRLKNNLLIPSWFSFSEVITELKKRHPPYHKQGFTVFFTGLSGAGKSTIANALLIKLLEQNNRLATLLDGDIARKNLSSELNFSKRHRDLNIKRIGYVASEITKHKGIAICAPIAPHRQTRREIRKIIENYGGFIEVYVATPLEVCEKRDIKGLYKKARLGIIKNFTGISDKYEKPVNPEITINTTKISPASAVQSIILELESLGYIK